MNLQQWHNKQMENGGYKAEYEALAPRYDLIKQIIATRSEKQLTQKQLADAIGVKQSNIARFESGDYNPSLNFLMRVAKGLGKNLEVKLN